MGSQGAFGMHKHNAAVFSMAALNPMLWLHWVSQDCLVLAPIPAKQ
jgi:hypothetical protein